MPYHPNIRMKDDGLQKRIEANLDKYAIMTTKGLVYYILRHEIHEEYRRSYPYELRHFHKDTYRRIGEMHYKTK